MMVHPVGHGLSSKMALEKSGIELQLFPVGMVFAFTPEFSDFAKCGVR
jgi:hypothetical protein